MPNWDKFKDSWGEVKDLFEDAFKAWREENAEDLTNMPREAIEAVEDLALISIIPKNAFTLSINNYKMKRAADLLQYAADQREQIERLQDSAQRATQKLLQDLGMLVVKLLIGSLL